jgi:PTH2 family peptidyl-tRNA hydrolase
MGKQVIVIRKDLKMRRGKEIAQGAHASIAFLTNRIREYLKGLEPYTQKPPNTWIQLSEAEMAWIKGRFRKICCIVDSEEELLELHKKAEEAGLVSSLIQDSGKTEFHGEATYTCLAIGPDDDAKIDKITRHLTLY